MTVVLLSVLGMGAWCLLGAGALALMAVARCADDATTAHAASGVSSIRTWPAGFDPAPGRPVSQPRPARGRHAFRLGRLLPVPASMTSTLVKVSVAAAVGGAALGETVRVDTPLPNRGEPLSPVPPLTSRSATPARLGELPTPGDVAVLSAQPPRSGVKLSRGAPAAGGESTGSSAGTAATRSGQPSSTGHRGASGRGGARPQGGNRGSRRAGPAPSRRASNRPASRRKAASHRSGPARPAQGQGRPAKPGAGRQGGSGKGKAAGGERR